MLNHPWGAVPGRLSANALRDCAFGALTPLCSLQRELSEARLHGRHLKNMCLAPGDKAEPLGEGRALKSDRTRFQLWKNSTSAVQRRDWKEKSLEVMEINSVFGNNSVKLCIFLVYD